MTNENVDVDDVVEEAAETLAPVWPLHSFVAANPLVGHEHQGFHEALEEKRRTRGCQPYPDVETLERAWRQGEIEGEKLENRLDEHGADAAAEASLENLRDQIDSGTPQTSSSDAVDRVTAKWLAAHLDEGQASWTMPDREKGFYRAWMQLAPYDRMIPRVTEADELPESPEEAVAEALEDVDGGRRVEVCRRHLESLSGWTGYIKRRHQDPHDPWNEEAPVSLKDYLAVRFTVADALDETLEPRDFEREPESHDIERAWLEAWEDSYRRELLSKLNSTETRDREDPAKAKLVFCIDTRSEVIRRKIERQGPWETHGYAGFFGVPMLYQPRDKDHPYTACPPIVEPVHHVESQIRLSESQTVRLNRHYNAAMNASQKHLKSMKENVVAAFPFVEGAGTAYGAAMFIRTLTPRLLHTAYDRVKDVVGRPEIFTEPGVKPVEDYDTTAGNSGSDRGIPLESRVEIAEDAFDLMGWKEIPEVVAFVGHAAETTNNAFDSSLDCGACAGQPGGPNAKVFAKIFNDVKVQKKLRERGHEIPEDTVFVAGEHNTTTDEVTLYTEEAPPGQDDVLRKLEDDLDEAREEAAEERRNRLVRTTQEDGVEETERRAFDWAETQPEWGLAGNAAFVVAPRKFTRNVDLEGRVFLHSYDYETDPDAEALKGIIDGPAVVTQMINNHYYFATVDDSLYGSGSKTTQNPVGNAMVYQGTAGDIMTGLPRESLRRTDDVTEHDPIRLTVVIRAPRDQVETALEDSDKARQLLDNGWIHLAVVDPSDDDTVLRYRAGGSWTTVEVEGATPEEEAAAPKSGSMD